MLAVQNKRIEADGVIVATGGLSYPTTCILMGTATDSPRQPAIR